MNGIALVVADQPVAEALRLFHRKHRAAAGPARIVSAVQDGQVNGAAFAIGGGRAGRDPGPETFPAPAGDPDRGGRGDRRRRARWTSANTAGVSVLGPLPQGLPTFEIPWLGFADLGAIVIGGCAVALVAFADTSVLSRTYAARTKTSVDPNQEMIGAGRRESRGGLFPGLSDQQQFVAHAGRRSGGCQDPAHRRRRRAGGGPAPRVRRPISCATCRTAPLPRW